MSIPLGRVPCSFLRDFTLPSHGTLEVPPSTVYTGIFLWQESEFPKGPAHVLLLSLPSSQVNAQTQGTRWLPTEKGPPLLANIREQGPYLLPCIKQPKKTDKINGTTVSRHWTSSSIGDWVLRRKNEISSTTACTYCLGRVSRPWHREWVHRRSPTVSPSGGEGVGHPGRQTQPQDQRPGGRRYAKREFWKPQRIPLQCSAECWQYGSGLEGTIRGPQIEPRITSVPTSQSGKTS